LNSPEQNSPEYAEAINATDTPSAVKSTARHAGAPVLPSAAQLATVRAAKWHQHDKPLLTLEALREWVNRCGMVAYGPRVQQLGAPAGSILEATLGKRLDAAAEPSGGDAARTLLARLIAEGSAVPLNLLGATGGIGTDVPDYVASAAVFAYVFTLRGNKAWKQPPVTAGAVKVSPLALAAYEMLAAKVTLSAYDLATQLGKEVTEGAVLRALTELWAQLRVIPVPQADATATLWELTQSRFTKQIKAGANAGQPTALSALISLYLGHAVAASEDEVETFLSPLAPRSRVRDVIHALLPARQLETVVVDGKTLLHVAGDLPTFATASVLEEVEEDASGEAVPSSAVAAEPRIKKFTAKPGSKIGTGLRVKPAFASKPSFASKPAFAKKPAFGAKPPFGDRERRPFQRDDKPAFQKPRFDKPWAEKPPVDNGRPSFAASGQAKPPRPEYKPRVEGDGPRKTFSKPGTFARKREGFSAKPAFDRSQGRSPRREFSAEARPPRRDAGDRPSRPAGGGFKRTSASAGSYSPRPKPAFGADRGGDRKPSFGRKPAFGDKPAFGSKPPYKRAADSRGDDAAPRKTFRKFDAPREKKPFAPKPFAAAKPFADRPARSFDKSKPKRGEASFADGSRPQRPGPAAGSKFGAKPAFGGAKPAFSGAKPAFGGAKPAFSGAKPAFRGAKPAFRGKSSAGKQSFARAGGPFAKFADGKKPFRKPGRPASPAKPAGAPKGDGGYRPTKRRKPEEAE